MCVFTALHGMQTRSSDKKAVCPSVRLSNAWIVTKRKKDLSIFLYHTKDILPSCLRRRMVGGDEPFYVKFWVNCPRWSEIADFELIFARRASAVPSSEKRSINTNRKSTTRFPMSLSPPPQGRLKNAKRPISV